MPLPSLNAIRAFEAAARLGSFKLAAEELGLTPSAVSRHIRSLETAIGEPLFERGFREVRLTARAGYYARRLTRAFETIDAATVEVSSGTLQRQRSARRITLSVNAVFMSLWLADRLVRFRARHPDAEIDVSTHDDSGKGGNPKADLRILFSDEDAEGPGLVPLVPLVIIPVCAPGLAKGSKPIRKPADLKRHRLLHENTTGWWQEWIEAEGVEGVDARSGSIFHDPVIAIREAVNGGGVALADNIMAEDLIARGLLVAPFKVRRRIPNTYSLVISPRAARLATVQSFRDWLLGEIAAHKRAMRIA